MKRLILLFAILAFAVTGHTAEVSKVGSSGAQFLKIAVGARYQALGEASVALANDAYAMYWNPAGLAEVDNWDLTFTRVDWLLDVNLDHVAAAHYFENVGTFGISASVLSMDDQEITTFEDPDGSGEFYNASSWQFGISYARQLTSQFAFGLTAKYLGEKIHRLESSGFAFDFGTLLYTGFNSLRLGMSITNMGPEMKFGGDDLAVPYDEQGSGNAGLPAELKTTGYDLPMTFRFGMAYDFPVANSAILTTTAELKHPNDNLQQGALGAELAVSEQFFLRGGYKINYEEEGLALGGGLLTTVSGDTRLVIDYAWQDFGRLESAQRFSIGFRF